MTSDLLVNFDSSAVGATRQPVDLDLGTRRAGTAALLTMALPGSVYVYQGEELGLWEVEDIPDERRQDPRCRPGDDLAVGAPRGARLRPRHGLRG
jgi:glycosidase